MALGLSVIQSCVTQAFSQCLFFSVSMLTRCKNTEFISTRCVPLAGMDSSWNFSKLGLQTQRKRSEVELTLRVFITVGPKLGGVHAPRLLALGIDLETKR